MAAAVSLTRRQFLTGSGAIALGSLTSGCGRFQETSLQVEVLDGSIPVQLLKRFRSEIKAQGSAQFIPLARPEAAFRQLQRWHPNPASQGKTPLRRLRRPWGPPPRPSDLVTLGDSWLTAAIRQDLIRPLDPQALSLWPELAPSWRQLVQRDDQGFLSETGPIWGAPYRWGGTLIAYRKTRLQKLGLQIQDWQDLWHPALKGLISLPDNAREVIGLTLKRLGRSYNELNPAQVSGLDEALADLHRQVKLYASDNYLQPLLLEDTWVAVGPSADLLPLLQRDRNLALVFPASGSALWADLWVQPNASGSDSDSGGAIASTQPLVNAWINFCWSPEIVKLLTSLSPGASPLAQQPNLAWLEKLQNREILLPPEAALAQSEFIAPLPEATLQQYAQLWQNLRNSTTASA